MSRARRGGVSIVDTSTFCVFVLCMLLMYLLYAILVCFVDPLSTCARPLGDAVGEARRGGLQLAVVHQEGLE